FYEVFRGNGQDVLFVQKASPKGDFIGSPVQVHTTHITQGGLAASMIASNGADAVLCWFPSSSARCDRWDPVLGVTPGDALHERLGQLTWSSLGYLLLAEGAGSHPKQFVQVVNDLGQVAETGLTIVGQSASLLAPTPTGFVVDLGYTHIQRFDGDFHADG